MTATRTYQVDAAPPRTSAVRRRSFQVVTAVLCLALAVTSLHSLIVGWVDTSDGGARRFDDIGWGVIEGVIVLTGLISQLRRPDRYPSGLRQAGLGLLALAVGGAATGAFDPASALVLLLVAVLGWLHPRRQEVLARPRHADRLLLAAAATMTAPLLVWVAVIAHTAHSVAPSSVHASHQDYAGLVGLALGLALTALLAATSAGAPLPARSVGVGLLLVGTASLVLPHQSDALPGGWAIVAILAGGAFPLLCWTRARSGATA